MMGDTLDEAVYRSWNNQKKEYQDEIWKLTNEVSKYREKLDRIQSKLLSGDMNARGRNSVNMQEYDRYDHCNASIVSGFCRV
jgi:predicted  nucleic acid-binding Zn-ribbon protein